MNLDKNKVVVGLSGGVDSTVAAYLLKKKGYDVVGVTFKLSEEFNINGAKKVSEKLNIPLYIKDYSEEFDLVVKSEFIREYLKGRTPNPCVTCNKYIKYDKMLKFAKSIGAYYIATGHYANIIYDKSINRYKVYKCKINFKDQSYVLYSLSQNILKHTLLPLGNFKSKKDVRDIAKQIDIDISEKKESKGICFIPNNDYVTYIKNELKEEILKGNIVDLNGNVLGKHAGIINYTIGQRKGLGDFNKRMYVIDINPDKNEVILGSDNDTFVKGLIAKEVNFIFFDKLKKDIKVKANISQHGFLFNCRVSNHEKEKIKVIFQKKVRSVAPGQSIVFYDDDKLIGGAVIDYIIK
ncbi:MAG: tRNA 2-thiouridine(34) synthase MnmA [Firmicutes bacterium]|nr:tRNA 2-thiouridine(34) synthase MnmA [Bacillota bacterium]